MDEKVGILISWLQMKPADQDVLFSKEGYRILIKSYGHMLPIWLSIRLSILAQGKHRTESSNQLWSTIMSGTNLSSRFTYKSR